MTSNKLPPYFERYFEQKFGEVNSRIEELKLHVNDELQDLKQMVKANQNNIIKLWIAVIILIAYHILMEEGSKFSDLIKTFI